MAGAIVVRLPAGSVGSSEFNGSDPLAGAKAYHRHRGELKQNRGTAAAAQRQTVYAARASGKVLEFRCGVSVAALLDATVTVDLLKNGVSVLAAAVVLDSGNAAFDLEDALFSDDSYVADDVFEINVTVSAGSGTLPQGLLAQALFEERP